MWTSPHLSFWWIQTRKIATVLYTLWLWFLSKLSKKTFHILLHLALTTNSVRERLHQGLQCMYRYVTAKGISASCTPPCSELRRNWEIFFTFSWNMLWIWSSNWFNFEKISETQGPRILENSENSHIRKIYQEIHIRKPYQKTISEKTPPYQETISENHIRK